jgi:hypothetical protein
MAETPSMLARLQPFISLKSLSARSALRLFCQRFLALHYSRGGRDHCPRPANKAAKSASLYIKHS